MIQILLSEKARTPSQPKSCDSVFGGQTTLFSVGSLQNRIDGFLAESRPQLWSLLLLGEKARTPSQPKSCDSVFGGQI